MSHYKMSILEETGYVVLDSYGEPMDQSEWLSLEYCDWKSSGVTRFAPLASAYGDIECNGFWHHNPPKADKQGVWIESQTSKAPTLTERVKAVEANPGRVRIIELQPNTYADALYNSHLDDNNRLNPDGEGWVIRTFMQLSDNPDSVMILRSDVNDPSTEVRIALPAGAQLVVDSERMWHSVWHQGDEPRYCLIISFESGPELEKWIWENNPVTEVPSAPIDPEYAEEQRAEATERRDARTKFYGHDPSAVYYDEA